MGGLKQFAVGELVNLNQRVRPPDGAAPEVVAAYEWPEFCLRMKKTIPGDGAKGEFFVPPLLRCSVSGSSMLVYEIGMPAAFDSMQPRIELPEFLRSAKGATAVAVRDLTSEESAPLLAAVGYPPMPVIRVSLSMFELPTDLPFTVDMLHPDPDVVEFGVLSEGSRLRWNLAGENPHGLFVGASGSGKTEAVRALLWQLHLSGEWHLMVLCPDVGDPNYAPFADLGHDVVAGSEVEDYRRALSLVSDLVENEFPARGREMGEHACPVWGARDGVEWRGRRTGKRVMVVWEEAKTWLQPSAADSEEVAGLKRSLAALSLAISSKGRKYRAHAAYVAQAPYVAAFGGPLGGDTLANVQFRLVVRSLEKKFHDVMCPDTTSMQVAKVLLNPSTPKGRAICRGAMDPGGEFRGSVNDTPVQLAWFGESGERLDALLTDVEARDSAAALVSEAEAVLAEAADGGRAGGGVAVAALPGTGTVGLVAAPVSVSVPPAPGGKPAESSGSVAPWLFGMLAMVTVVVSGALPGLLGVVLPAVTVAAAFGGLVWWEHRSDGSLHQAAIAGQAMTVVAVVGWAAVRVVTGGWS